MKWLLFLLVVSVVLTWSAFISAKNGPADDFGIGIIAWLGALFTLVLFVVYVALVFWNHRFW